DQPQVRPGPGHGRADRPPVGERRLTLDPSIHGSEPASGGAGSSSSVRRAWPMRDDRAVTTEPVRAPSGLRELAFLHEIAQLATLAPDWDELMRTIVDGTTAAMDVEVCSFYLADREHTRLTLAATNGLDRSQVGRVSLAWGEGITGRVAASQRPLAVEDVTTDERFAWVRGFDI